MSLAVSNAIITFSFQLILYTLLPKYYFFFNENQPNSWLG